MRRNALGLTLIEVMVVMVIIAILLTMVSFSLRGDRMGERLDEEARRLAALLDLLREEAIMREQTLGLARTDEGYAFVIRTQPAGEAPAFRLLGDDPLFRPRALPAGTRIVLEIGPAARPLAPSTPPPHGPLLLALPHDLLIPTGRLLLTHPSTPRVAVVPLDGHKAWRERADGRT